MSVAVGSPHLVHATPLVLLPDLNGTTPPMDCPLCAAPLAPEAAELAYDALGLRDIRDVVLYACGSGYAPSRTDYAADPALWHLAVHYEGLHPRRFLALFCAYYRDRLGDFDVTDLPGMDPASLARLR